MTRFDLSEKSLKKMVLSITIFTVQHFGNFRIGSRQDLHTKNFPQNALNQNTASMLLPVEAVRNRDPH